MEITSGASNDFFKVNSLARQMVTRFGMSSLTPMAMELYKLLKWLKMDLKKLVLH